MPGRGDGGERSTEDSVTLSLRANRAWGGIRAGQFVQVSVEIDGVRHNRCYSPASAEGRGRELEITAKRHPDGLVSNFLADHAQPGMVFGLSQADGDFHLPDARPDSILLIGAGSGITPLMAIIRTLCADGHPGPDRTDPVRPGPRSHDLPPGARPPGGGEPELHAGPLLHAGAGRR